jgi:vacuolar-type H+-ATPase subunit H
VTLVLASLWVFVGVLTLAWLLWSGKSRSSGRPHARKGRSEAAPVDELDAEWIYGDRAGRNPPTRLVDPDAPTSDGEAVLKAKHKAATILEDAEAKAREILAEAERTRREVEAELARERAEMAEKSKKLSEFLVNTLDEVERVYENGSGNAHDLGELESLRDELRSTE